MILVVSSARDEHARAVLAELERLRADARLLDLADFPVRSRLSMRYGSECVAEFALQYGDGTRIDLRRVGAVWWRRPQPFTIDPSITRPSHRAFAYGESHEAFAGLWQVLTPYWVNHPVRDERAAHKAYQLDVARTVGLEIPGTLITNDPEEARRFVEHRGSDPTVYKAFTATEHEWRETRLVRSGELALLRNVRHAPVIFQEYVPAAADVRVTVVGHELYAAAIHAQETAYPFDFRVDMHAARTETVTIPAAVRDRLLALMDRLDLVYGAIDMRLTPDGRYVFLEINPAGQWLFVEQRVPLPISAALARILATHDHPGR